MPVELPAVAAPIVRPATVTVTVLLAGIAGVPVVMTIWVMVGMPTVPVETTPPALIITVTPGVPVTKNPAGYISVIVPPAAMDPAAEVVNENVAEAPVLPATRSDVAIKNEVLVTEVLAAAATRAGVVAPALTTSVAVRTFKPVAVPAVTAPVVSSPGAKVILCAPGAKSAVAVSQTMVRVAAVKVQVAVSVAVPPAAGTRTPAGVALALK